LPEVDPVDETEDYSLILPDDDDDDDDESEAAAAARRPIRVYVNGVEQRPAQAVGSFLTARAIDSSASAEDETAGDAVVGGRVTVSTPFCTRTGIR
jgi:hypothetical protein